MGGDAGNAAVVSMLLGGTIAASDDELDSTIVDTLTGAGFDFGDQDTTGNGALAALVAGLYAEGCTGSAGPTAYLTYLADNAGLVPDLTTALAAVNINVNTDVNDADFATDFASFFGLSAMDPVAVGTAATNAFLADKQVIGLRSSVGCARACLVSMPVLT